MQSFDVFFMVSQNLFDSIVQENHTKPTIMEDGLNVIKYSIIWEIISQSPKNEIFVVSVNSDSSRGLVLNRQ